MGVMAKKKPKSGKRTGGNVEPREAFHLSPELQLALELAAVTAEPPAGKSSVLRFALEKYLTQKGLYPPTDEQLEQLLGRKALAELSPQAQAYLRKKGLAGGSGA